MYFDPLYFIFAIPGIVLGLIAQFWIKAAYSGQSRNAAGSGLTGAQAAQLVAQNENFKIGIQSAPGELSDNFNPVNNVVSISEANLHSNSVAALAVVAHELGHVQQKFHSSPLFAIRSLLVPAVQLGSNIGYLLIIVGLILAISQLAVLGLILFASTTLFAFLNLPLEIDASRRGMEMLAKYKLISADQTGGARSVLTAAAFSYFAGFVTSLLTLLYFANLVSRSDDR